MLLTQHKVNTMNEFQYECILTVYSSSTFKLIPAYSFVMT